MKIDEISIGALILTLDSESFIQNTLESIKNICNQIVVIDTGSIDATPCICSRFGCEIHFFQWVDNFSLARNYGLNFIRTDWIIIIDSDEELIVDTLINNLHYFQNKNIGGLQTEIENVLESNGNNLLSKHKYTRIFRNNKQIKFNGKVHEQISQSIVDSGFKIIDTNIKIKHFGYINKNQKKSERNKNLILVELKDNPEDDWLKYHLAETEFSLGNLTSSKKIFIEIADSIELSKRQKDMIFLRLSQIALKQDDLMDIYKYTHFRSEDIDIEGLRNFILSLYYLQVNEIARAYDLLNLIEVKQSGLVDNNIYNSTLELIKKMMIQ